MELIKSGVIKYDISVVMTGINLPNVDYEVELYKKTIEQNTVLQRTVHFNGDRSLTEEVNNDYGFKSPVKIIRHAHENSYQYCKEFYFFNFCFDIKTPLPASQETGQSKLTLFDEYKVIHGYKCRKALIEDARLQRYVYFTDSIAINDPTGAVLQDSKINGLIMEMEEIPLSASIHFYKKYLVTGIENEFIQPSIFNIPDGYMKFAGIEEVRNENTRLLNEGLIPKIKPQLYSGLDENIFVGNWIYKSGEHIQLIHIESLEESSGMGKVFSFRLLNLGEKKSDAVDLDFKKAFVRGGFLFVEELPNFNLYEFDQKHNLIVLAGDNEFKYLKASEEIVKEIKERFKIGVL